MPTACGAFITAEHAWLDAAASRQSAQTGQVIAIEGDRADTLFIITGGAVKTYKQLADGRRQIMGFLFAGDLFDLDFSSRYACTAEAMDPVSLYRLSRARLDALLGEFPDLEQRLLLCASNELAAAQEQMLLLGRKRAQERAATFLVLLSDRAGTGDGDGGRIDLPMSRGISAAIWA